MNTNECSICGIQKPKCQEVDNHLWCQNCLWEFDALFKPYKPCELTVDKRIQHENSPS